MMSGNPQTIGQELAKDKTNEIPPANSMNRFLAFLIDLICLFLVSSVLNGFLAPVVRNQFYNQSELILQYGERLESTHLYVKEGEGEKAAYYPLYQHPSYYGKTLSDEEKDTYIQLLEDGITYFVESEEFTCFTMDDYKSLQKEAESVFSFDETLQKYVVKEDAKKDDILSFYQEACKSSVNSLSKDEKLMTVYKQIMGPRRIELLVCVTITAIIFFLIIPLCTKYRQTVGKKMMRLTVVDSKEKVTSRLFVLYRFLILYPFELLSSVYLFGMPLLASITVACFTKKKSAIHDLILRTKVVSIDDIPEEVNETQENPSLEDTHVIETTAE